MTRTRFGGKESKQGRGRGLFEKNQTDEEQSGGNERVDDEDQGLGKLNWITGDSDLENKR